MFVKHPVAVTALGCVVECPIPAFHRKEVRDSQQPAAARVVGGAVKSGDESCGGCVMLWLSWVETSKVSSRSWKRVEEDEEWCVELILCRVWGLHCSLSKLWRRVTLLSVVKSCKKMKNVRKRESRLCFPRKFLGEITSVEKPPKLGLDLQLVTSPS